MVMFVNGNRIIVVLVFDRDHNLNSLQHNALIHVAKINGRLMEDGIEEMQSSIFSL